MAISSSYIHNFLQFSSQLQLSCAFYSNVAMRQMGYLHAQQETNSTPYQPQQRLGQPCRRVELEESDVDDDDETRYAGNTATTVSSGSPIPIMTPGNEEPPPHQVARQEREENGVRQRRKVNFADPLSEYSATPRHSIESSVGPSASAIRIPTDTHFRMDNNERTGFTSDSEEEGSETDVLCDYFRRVRKGEIQHGSQKIRANQGNQQPRAISSFNAFGFSYDAFQDDEIGFYEMPLNEVEYEIINHAILPEDREERELLNLAALNDMQYLYGESGSHRILQMEDTVDHLYAYMLRNCYR